VKVIDNYIPTAYQDALEDLLLGDRFPWHLNRATSPAYGFDIAKNTTTDSHQFTHRFFEDGQAYSEYFNFLSPVLHHLMLTENIDTTKIMRIKSNLNVPLVSYPKGHHYVAHKDYAKQTGYITAIYYVNESQGDTKFFNPSGEVTNSVSPKKGRLVYFNGNTYHAGCPPKDNVRCVINFNFMSKETK
jgi:Rps23 Pro-64 3,4-dihydroxylase Tpa1-like proline 4-hydroxylase